MRYIFRDREDPDSLAEIPFFENASFADRKLEERLNACAEHFCIAQSKEYLDRLSCDQRGRIPQGPKPERWPDLQPFGLPLAEFWKYESAFGQLNFAPTKQRQQKARSRTRALARRGPNQFRQMLATAIRKTPQAKRIFFGLDIVKIVEFRAKRQFMWAFLRYESGLTYKQMRDPKYIGHARDLAQAYPFLGLTDQKIFEGMRNPRQADKDTAEKFHISPSSVRSLLSKSHPR